MLAALRLFGTLNAGMPFEIASTPGERGAAAGEGPQNQEQRQRLHGVGCQHRHALHHWQCAGGKPHEADAKHQQCHANEEIGRPGEHTPRFLHTAQVDHSHQHDHHDADLDLERARHREGRGDLRDTRGDTDCNGQHIIGQQRCPGRLCHAGAQVVARDDIRTTAARVGKNRLAIRERQHDQ